MMPRFTTGDGGVYPGSNITAPTKYVYGGGSAVVRPAGGGVPSPQFPVFKPVYSMIPTPLRSMGPAYSGPSGLSPASPIAPAVQAATGQAADGGTGSAPLAGGAGSSTTISPTFSSSGSGLTGGGFFGGESSLLLLVAGAVLLYLVLRKG